MISKDVKDRIIHNLLFVTICGAMLAGGITYIGLMIAMIDALGVVGVVIAVIITGVLWAVIDGVMNAGDEDDGGYYL